ncbi:MAG: HipA domain-containing protein [Bacteroidota bacterium]
MKGRCLYCYEEINAEELSTPAGTKGYHEKCSRKFFGKASPPTLPLTQDQLLEFASQIVKTHKTVTGVQPKLSLGVAKDGKPPLRFTIMGILGEYILKPQTEMYANLPENEDLCMHLAQLSKIKTVDHGLIRLQSGELAYLTKRVDRIKGKKLHMEDMCQLTERLTEYKYRGSYEQIAKAIKRYSVNPGLDLIDFFEVVLFSFLTGNNDAHLKNFSLLKTKIGYQLCPAYDLVASALVVEDDNEELALSLNGKKRKLKRKDFEIAMTGAGIPARAMENLFRKYQKLIPQWKPLIQKSFLPATSQEALEDLIQQRSMQLGLHE